MRSPTSPESIATIRALFFRRLAETNRDLIQAHIDITLQINQQNHHGVVGILLDVENRVQAMRTILIVFDECLEG